MYIIKTDEEAEKYIIDKLKELVPDQRYLEMFLNIIIEGDVSPKELLYKYKNSGMYELNPENGSVLGLLDYSDTMPIGQKYLQDIMDYLKEVYGEEEMTNELFKGISSGNIYNYTAWLIWNVAIYLLDTDDYEIIT